MSGSDAAASLHIMCGLPCSGKTTLAKKLEKELPALRLGPDEWVIDLVPDRDQDEVGRQRPILNAIQWKLAQQALALGTNVILEHGFWSPNERLTAIETLSSSNVHVHMHYLNVTMPVLQARLRLRNENLPSDCFYISPNKLEAWAPEFMPPTQAELNQFHEYTIYEPKV